MLVTFLVEERAYRITVKGKWLECSVQALASRVLKERCEGCVLRCGGSLVDGSACVRRTLSEGAVIDVERAASFVVVTLLTGSFSAIFEMWYARFSEVVAAELVVCCLDGDAEDVVERVTGLRSVRILGARDGFRPPTTRADLWSQRLDAVTRVVASESRGAKRQVVHSDCDAFWLEDVTPLLRDDHLALFSVDHGLGRGRKPFALCCGFYRLAATREALDFLQTWKRATLAVGDDQIAVNALYDRDPAPFGTLPYEAVQRCNCNHATRARPLVWHPWLDATVDDKVYVWGTVLRRLDRGDTTLLADFYAAKPSVALTRTSLDGLLRSGAERSAASPPG